MINKVFLMGYLGQDPESRTTGSGTTVVSLRMATTERQQVQGSWQDVTEWHSCVAFGQTAEAIAKFLKKGSGVHVEGKLRTRKWQDREGKDRYTTEVIVDKATFLPKAKSESQEPRHERPDQERHTQRRHDPAPQRQEREPETYRPPDYGSAPNDDDVPF